MCTNTCEQVAVAGCARGTDRWLQVTLATVSYDHPARAPYEHALTIDLAGPSGGADPRIAIELSPSAALRLADAIRTALASDQARADLAAEASSPLR